MSQKQRNYVPSDGYSIPGFIDERDGIIEAVRFVYRPISADMQSSFNASLALLQDTPNNPANFRKRAEIVKGRLVSWDVKDDKGAVLPITTAEVRKLSPELFWKLFGIVFGTIPTDIDPQWADEQQEEESRLAADAAQEGVTVGAVREAADEKN
jgi:hypothetical protein